MNRRAVGSAERGQATVEAALTLPIVLIALLLIVQVGIVVRDALALAQAAREGARAAAVTARDDAVENAIERSAGPLHADRIDIEITPAEAERVRGDIVSVKLAYVERLGIPIVSRIVSMDLPLRASASMRLERGHPTPTPQPTPSPEPTLSPEPSPSASTTPTSEPSPTPEPPAEPAPTPEPQAPSEPPPAPAP